MASPTSLVLEYPMETFGQVVPWAIIVIVVVLAAASTTVLIIRTRNRRNRAKQRARQYEPAPFPTAEYPPNRKTPDNLGYNDLVVYGGVTHTVRGVILLDEEGFRWKEFWLDSAGSKVWLSVERDPELEVVEWSEVKTNLVPGKKKLTYNGKLYTLDEDGIADYEALGTTGLPGKGKVEYFDYVGPDNELLSFERFDCGDWEVAEGFVLFEEMYELYPNPRRSSV